MAITVLEDIICRIHDLKLDQPELWDECAALGALIVRTRTKSPYEKARWTASENKPVHVKAMSHLVRLHREDAGHFVAGLILLDLIMGQRIGRPASFSNIHRQLRECRAHRGKQRFVVPFVKTVLNSHPAFEPARAALPSIDRVIWTCLTLSPGPQAEQAIWGFEELLKSATL